jgi:hypothetical protein
MARSTREAQILKALDNGEEQTWDQVSSKLPDLEWNELFAIFDVLTRRGKITMRRRGVEYVVKLCQTPSLAKPRALRAKIPVSTT